MVGVTDPTTLFVSDFHIHRLEYLRLRFLELVCEDFRLRFRCYGKSEKLIRRNHLD